MNARDVVNKAVLYALLYNRQQSALTYSVLWKPGMSALDQRRYNESAHLVTAVSTLLVRSAHMYRVGQKNRTIFESM